MDIRSRLMFYRARGWSLKHRLILLIKKAWLVHKEKSICNEFQRALDKSFPLQTTPHAKVAENYVNAHIRGLAAALPQCNIHHRLHRVDKLITVYYCIEFKKSLNTYNRRNYILIR